MPISFNNHEGSVLMSGTYEDLVVANGASGVYTHTFGSFGNIVIHQNVAGNITLNITNLPATVNQKIIIITQIIEQGATAYGITALQIAGAAQTINWANGVAPTPTANKREVYTFALYNRTSTWVNFCSMTSYG